MQPAPHRCVWATFCLLAGWRVDVHYGDVTEAGADSPSTRQLADGVHAQALLEEDGDAAPCHAHHHTALTLQFTNQANQVPVAKYRDRTSGAARTPFRFETSLFLH